MSKICCPLLIVARKWRESMHCKWVYSWSTLTRVQIKSNRVRWQVVSILAEWSSINRAKLSEFENDARFIKLCRQLGRAPAKPGPTGNAPKKFQSNDFRTEDVNMVLSIAGDDEASTLVATLSIPQMIRVMSALALKKRRSTPLLRSLSFHISSSSERLNLKQCGDLLFAMAVLNFPDSVLIARVGMDIQNGLAENQDKPAVVGSIVTSLGLLKFRNSGTSRRSNVWKLPGESSAN